MMHLIIKFFLIFVAIASFTFSIQAFLGKENAILSRKYTCASKEEREKMDKNAYLKQTAIIFLFIGIVPLLIAFTLIFKMIIFYYSAIVCGVAGVIYFIVSSRSINNKQNKD